MVDILLKVGVKASSPEGVFRALTTIDGLSAWWTKDTRGDAKAGGVVQFRFEMGGFDMKVVELTPGKRVMWHVVDGPEEWVGTNVIWDLQQEGAYAVVRFTHQGWKAPSDFMHHCSMKWAVFLMSLKALLETGKGAAHPDDVRVFDDKQ